MRVGAAHGRRQQLPDVRGQGLQPRGSAVRCAGRGAEAVEVGGGDHVHPAHEGGHQERVGFVLRVQRGYGIPMGTCPVC